MIKTMNQNAVRLDKWLWAARFYKTRTLAAQAIRGGKVHIEGVRAKPSRMVSSGNRLTITQGPYSQEIVVCQLSETRGPASLAETLYAETDASRQARVERREQIRLNNLSAPRTRGRPDKHTRRQLIQHKGKH